MSTMKVKYEKTLDGMVVTVPFAIADKHSLLELARNLDTVDWFDQAAALRKLIDKLTAPETIFVDLPARLTL